MFSKYRRINRSFTSKQGHTFQNDHAVSLLYILKDRLLRHEFAQSAAVMESLAYVMDVIPSIYRKVGIEVLSHRPQDYGRCLQFMKQIFSVHQSTSRVREEMLLEMCLFIASHGNLAESYDIMTSHVSADPFKSNPLIVGYCGLMAYLLWKEEIRKGEELATPTSGYRAGSLDLQEVHSEALDSRGESPVSREAEVKVTALASSALLHFEQLSSMMSQHDCSVSMFVHKHAQLLERLGRQTDALNVLLRYQESCPREINANRYVCDHLRTHCPDSIELRTHHLAVLVQLDESCTEVMELLELQLHTDGTHNIRNMFETLVKFLDYPCNGADPRGWSLLRQIQLLWPEYSSSELWTTRLHWWRKLYPHITQE
ncbi:hypothetical protein EMCRGX_G008515 [Ephydatia muelleri]